MDKSNKLAFACCDDGEYLQEGLTKREYFAAKAMQALISNPQIKRPQNDENQEEDLNDFSCVAVGYADGLIKALSKT